MSVLVVIYGKYKYLPIYIKVCYIYFGAGFCLRWERGDSSCTLVPLARGGCPHLLQPRAVRWQVSCGQHPSSHPAAPPRSGMEVKMGNSRNEKSWSLGWRQGDHLPITVAGKIDFKINSVYCLLLLLLPVLSCGVAVWATCRSGGAPWGSGSSGVSTSRSRTRVCLRNLKPPGTVLGNLSWIIMFIRPPFNYNSPLSESQLSSLA